MARPPRRPGSRRFGALVLAALLAVGLVALVVVVDRPGEDEPATMPTASLPWPSGVWAGGEFGVERVTEFAVWRGTRVDAVTMYPAYETWDELAESEWHASVYNDFEGLLVYGLPLLPKSGGSLPDVAAGRHDDVWTAVAGHLVSNDRGGSYVRVGLEANGEWFPWGSDADGAEDFRNAFRHVVGVMRTTAPDLRFVFDITCGHPLNGSDGRLDALTRLYPGDDVVDVVGCDAYDSYSTRVRSPEDWPDLARPRSAPGLLDVVEFARAHGKQFAVPEWGLTKSSADGGGDNAVFIEQMHDFFVEHQADLAFENYFNEPEGYLRSSVFAPVQNPRAAEAYARLWGSPSTASPDAGPGSEAG